MLREQNRDQAGCDGSGCHFIVCACSMATGWCRLESLGGVVLEGDKNVEKMATVC